MAFVAHILRDDEGKILKTQTAADHCKETSRIAAEVLETCCLDKPAYLAGMLHDMGKFKKEFQEYILSNDGRRGSVVHSFAGVKYILDTYRKKHVEEDAGDDEFDITAEIIAYAIGAHHGLFDIEYGTNENGFLHRTNAENISYEESCNNFFSECFPENEIFSIMSEAADQIKNVIDKIRFLPDDDQWDAELPFYMGLLERLILSAVIEGDRTDTSAFMASSHIPEYSKPVDWQKYLSKVENKLNEFPDIKTIDKARRKISDMCRAYANNSGGILSLNVPTGSGKTLSSLRFAIAHAASQNKQRIIFTAPLLTILEQNAAVLKEFIQDDSIILEHHSNVILQYKDNHSEVLDRYECMLDSWNSPIVITTMVQLLNTMFSGKTSSIRRFHSLSNSVIIIDEVQTVPLKLLSLFNIAIRFLAEVCGATIVLCSATQPNFCGIEHSLNTIPQEIVPYNEALWSVFKRTDLIDAGNYKLNDIPAFAFETLKNTNSLLIVCNKKSEAEFIYHEMNCDAFDCFHLSASMCTEHRRDTLNKLKVSLADAGKKTLCISTQVIEAGVDISFGSVIRLAAGMDSIVQSAGRCNRNAESDSNAPVYIVRLMDEDLMLLTDIKRGKDSTIALLEEFRSNREMMGDDLASKQSIEIYYEALYSCLAKGSTEYPIKDDTLFNLLGNNIKNSDCRAGFYYQQAFKTAGSLFEVFDDESIDVVVPYLEGEKIISALYDLQGSEFFCKLKELVEKSKGFTVSIYDYQRRRLEEAGGLHWLLNGSIAVLDNEYYDENTGITLIPKPLDYQEV